MAVYLPDMLRACLFSGLHQHSLVVIFTSLFFIFSRTIFRGLLKLISTLLKAFVSSTLIEKFIFVFILVLLLLRAFQAITPTTNWDGLNQHLPLLSARLDQGDLNPLFETPTDRRTPISGVLLKIPAYSFGLDGRSLSLTYFGIYIVILCQLWKLLSTLCSKTAALFCCACFASWTDIAVYFRHLGDEPLFCLFISSVITSLLIKPKVSYANQINFALLGLAFSIKLTTIFFVPFIGLIYLARTYKSYPTKTLIMSMTIGVLFALMPYLKQYHDYNMIYPLQRWTNLLEFGPDAPEVLSFETVREKRLEYGIKNHRDNKSVTQNYLSKWVENAKKLIYLPLGPYTYWIPLLIVFSLFRKVTFSEQKYFHLLSFSISTLIVLVCLNLAMSAWNFSPQAMTRYLLPIWMVWSISLGYLFYEFAYALKIETFLKFSFCFCLIISIVLELKYTVTTIQKQPWQNSQSYWLKYGSDGPLIQSWIKLTNNSKPATFYLGNNAYLFKQPQHQFAQVGNEVGWRDPKKFKEFLIEKGFKYLVYSHSAANFDPMYKLLKDYCHEKGILELQVSNQLGEIYRIQ